MSSRTCALCLVNNVTSFATSILLMASFFSFKYPRLSTSPSWRPVTLIPHSCFSTISFFHSMVIFFKPSCHSWSALFSYLYYFSAHSCHLHYSLHILVSLITSLHILVVFIIALNFVFTTVLALHCGAILDWIILYSSLCAKKQTKWLHRKCAQVCLWLKFWLEEATATCQSGIGGHIHVYAGKMAVVLCLPLRSLLMEAKFCWMFLNWIVPSQMCLWTEHCYTCLFCTTCFMYLFIYWYWGSNSTSCLLGKHLCPWAKSLASTCTMGIS